MLAAISVPYRSAAARAITADPRSMLDTVAAGHWRMFTQFWNHALLLATVNLSLVGCTRAMGAPVLA
jgi:hypothetical protein